MVVQDVQAAAAAAAVFQKCDASSALFAEGRLVSALTLTFSSFFSPVLPAEQNMRRFAAWCLLPVCIDCSFITSLLAASTERLQAAST